MVREYRWAFRVRSAEADAWGHVPTAEVLRYLEQLAVDAAGDAGYGPQFHDERNSAWVVRRMTIVMHSPIPQASDLVGITWASHMTRVRGGREYRLEAASMGSVLYTAYAEWVYVDRTTLMPIGIPKGVAADFHAPGAPIQHYEPPVVPKNGPGDHAGFTSRRRARWSEADSQGHVNNAVYLEWVDEAVLDALETAGFPIAALRSQGLHIRGLYYALEYKRSTMPGENLSILTRFSGLSEGQVSVEQSVLSEDGEEAMTSSAVYGWFDRAGMEAEPPQGWADLLSVPVKSDVG